jgi:ribosomal protein S18 acetylase RimI-like enzyme
MEVRRLGPADADELWRLRCEALEREPASFGESLEEHLAFPRAKIAERLGSTDANGFVYGAFDENSQLVATAGFFRESRRKRRHKGIIWGVYVSAGHRGRGLGRAVMIAALGAARQMPGLRYVYLSVTSAQSPARELYLSLGFRSFGREPGALAVDGQYFDEEHMILELADAPGDLR